MRAARGSRRAASTSARLVSTRCTVVLRISLCAPLLTNGQSPGRALPSAASIERRHGHHDLRRGSARGPRTGTQSASRSRPGSAGSRRGAASSACVRATGSTAPCPRTASSAGSGAASDLPVRGRARAATSSTMLARRGPRSGLGGSSRSSSSRRLWISAGQLQDRRSSRTGEIGERVLVAFAPQVALKEQVW